MYNAHYQFRECPFGVTPDPQFYYSNAVYREAWATLHYGIEGRKGFIVIAGEAGTGKTTLLRKALHQFPSNIKAAYIPNCLVTFSELLRLILKDLGLPSFPDSKFEMMERLNQYLLDQFDSQHIVALLIDEAQDLSLECLEELRLLGNLETDKHKLLQIVLVGQPGLERKLNQPELLQLKQRVVVRCWLQPVETGEVGSYIESRLQTIGHRSADLFDPEAIEKIALYSKGIPRLINIICDNALLTAYAASKFKVSTTMIDEVAGDLLIDEARVGPEVRSGGLTTPVEEKVSLDSAPAQEDNRRTRAESHRDSAHSRSGYRHLRPIMGALAAIVVLTVLGGFLYSRRQPFSNLDFPGNIELPVTSGRDEVGQAKLAASALEPKSSAINRELTLPPYHNETVPVANQLVSIVPPGETTNVPVAEERVAALITTGNKKSEPSGRDDRPESASSTENFFVSGASFVRSEPTSNAEIIATLEPGTLINIAGRTGAYYRVRSLGVETIRGYVHKEDAFFERP